MPRNYRVTVGDPRAVDPAGGSLDAATDSTLTGSGTGPYQWGPVTLQSYDFFGNPEATKIQTAEWDDAGIGVDGGRWNTQIDYSGEVNGGAGEYIDITFPGTVSAITVTLGMVGLNEYGIADETAEWFAYDGSDVLLASGQLHPRDSDLGWRTKETGSYGRFPYTLDLAGATPVKLRIVAAPWEKGNGDVFADADNGQSYDNPGEVTLNNSDVALSAISWS